MLSALKRGVYSQSFRSEQKHIVPFFLFHTSLNNSVRTSPLLDPHSIGTRPFVLGTNVSATQRTKTLGLQSTIETTLCFKHVNLLWQTRRFSVSEAMSSSDSKADSEPKVPELLKTADVIENKGDHKMTLIFLHGLGDQGLSFVPLFESLPKEFRVVLPNAPVMPITANGGYPMRAWFDISSFERGRDLKKPYKKEEILETLAKLTELLDYEVAKVGSAGRVVIGGFSQGGASSLLAGYNYKEQLGGVICCSGWHPLADEASSVVVQKSVPVLMYHGKDDEIVPVNLASETKQILENVGISKLLYFEEPDMGHEISNGCIRKVLSFISNAYSTASM